MPREVWMLSAAVTYRRATIALSLVVLGLVVLLASDVLRARELRVLCSRCDCHAK